jgi:cyclin B
MKPILKNHLQLCGVAALLIACKYEEIFCPDLSDLVYITDKAYRKDEIVFMEKEILKTLNYEITVPNPLKFYDLLAVNFAFDENEYYLGRYFLEIFLMDYRINKYPNSLVACAVVYLVLKISKYEDYRLINCYTLCAEKDLKNCAKEICFLVENIDSTNLLCIKTKYATKEYNEVSKTHFM